MRQRFLFFGILLIGQLSHATPLVDSEEWKSLKEMVLKAHKQWSEKLQSNSLPLSRQSRFQFSFLPHQTGFLENQIHLGRKIKAQFKDFPQAADQHDPLWGQWAQLLLDITDVRALCRLTTGFEGPEEIRIKAQFQTEVSDHINSSDTSYSWFSLFAIRLTFLSWQSTHSARTELSDFNTELTGYIQGLKKDKPLWKNHLATLNYFLTEGDIRTRTELSPWVYIQKFPEIIITPYPFSLSIAEIVLNRTCDDQPTWFAGFCQYDYRADGSELGQPLAYGHDLQHLAYGYLRTRVMALLWPPQENDQMLNEVLWREARDMMVEGRALWDLIFKTAVHQLKLSPTQGSEKKLGLFFLFLYEHEGLHNLHGALFHMFPQPDFSYNLFNFTKDPFHDMSYYLSEMPDEAQTLCKGSRETFLKIALDLFRQRLRESYIPANVLTAVGGYFQRVGRFYARLPRGSRIYLSAMLPYTSERGGRAFANGMLFYEQVRTMGGKDPGGTSAIPQNMAMVLHPESPHCPMSVIQNVRTQNMS